MALKFKMDTPEQREKYRKNLENIVLNELDPIADKIEAEDFIPDPDPVWVKFKAIDAYKLSVPKELGGYGLTFEQMVPLIETGAKGHAWVRGGTHGSHSFVGQLWRGIYNYGTKEQKDKWLPLALNGIAAGIAITELNTGSGVDVGTTAEKKGNYYIVNGVKKLISYAGRDDHYSFPAEMTLVRTGDKKLGEKALSVLIIDKDNPGVIAEEMEKFMMYHKAHYVTYDNAKVPAKNLLGAEGQGYEVIMKGFMEPSRISIGCSTTGICQRMLEISLDFAKNRVTFGKPIANRQMIQQMLAEMATNIHASRLIVTDAARRFDQGTLTPMYSSMAKMFAIEMSARVSDSALLIHGGLGLTKRYTMERLYRDVRSLWFEEGTPTVQKVTIARELLDQC